MCAVLSAKVPERLRDVFLLVLWSKPRGIRMTIAPDRILKGKRDSVLSMLLYLTKVSESLRSWFLLAGVVVGVSLGGEVISLLHYQLDPDWKEQLFYSRCAVLNEKIGKGNYTAYIWVGNMNFPFLFIIQWKKLLQQITNYFRWWPYSKDISLQWVYLDKVKGPAFDHVIWKIASADLNQKAITDFWPCDIEAHYSKFIWGANCDLPLVLW